MRFGTDGIRGLAVIEIDHKLAYRVGQAIARIKNNVRIIISKDTRESGDFILCSFVSGALSMGASIVDIGIAPTPCVSFLVKKLDFDFGVVISASHNPAEYNGIKIFESNGQKLSLDHEQFIERNIKKEHQAKLECLGKYQRREKLINIYKNYLINISNKTLDLKVVLDTSNGASYKIAPSVFRKLGAKVRVIGNKPNGNNINDKCGALNLENIKTKVIKTNADVGFAFDGDADRIIAIDEKGNEFDGDQIIYFIAKKMKELWHCDINAVVSTILTNTAIEKELTKLGIKMLRCDVGDKFVIDLMNKRNIEIGGEQSGHIIIKKFNATGDGVLTAVLISMLLNECKTKLSNERIDKLYHQASINLKTENKNEVIKNLELLNLKNIIESKYKDLRIILRASGTEPKIRIMVEHKNKLVANKILDKLSSKVLEIINNKKGNE